MAALLDHASDADRRAMALACCKLAVTETGVDSPVISLALDSLERGVYGQNEIFAPLEKLVEKSDDHYFAARKKYFSGEGEESEYRALFAKARAANAVL